MARSFGVSVAFIDRDLSQFVAAKRINCKIDKVGGIVETVRPDQKNAQYQKVIKQVGQPFCAPAHPPTMSHLLQCIPPHHRRWVVLFVDNVPTG